MTSKDKFWLSVLAAMPLIALILNIPLSKPPTLKVASESHENGSRYVEPIDPKAYFHSGIQKMMEGIPLSAEEQRMIDQFDKNEQERRARIIEMQHGIYR